MGVFCVHKPGFLMPGHNFEKLKPAIFFNFQYRVIHHYVDCASKSLCKSFAEGPSYGNYQPAMYWPFSNTFKCLLQADNSMTDRAYMGEVLIQVWMKSIK